MVCCHFIFKPGAYDEDFHHLDAQIDEYARRLPRFQRVEKWLAPEGGVVNARYYFADKRDVPSSPASPLTARLKGQVACWYDGYRI